MNENNRKIITILSIFTIIFTLMGGTLAYWNWSSDIRTGVTFTMAKDFSCSADGGENITPSNISLEPTTCENPNSAIKREIKVTPDIRTNGLEISMDLWLNINSIGSGLSDSYNFKYVLTTSGESCDKGTIISSGNFNGKKDGDKVVIMEKNYTADAEETYYLYLWLDAAETSSSTMNQTFDFSLGGVCSNYLGQPEAPVLDPGMIPVTIAEDGTVTTVSADDPNWYNYENKQWANIVLVEEEGAGETDSHPREYYQDSANVGKTVTEEDILAYYVWIPRYKYRIAQVKCSELKNPNVNDNPECYAPYILTTQEKENLIDHILYYFHELDGGVEENVQNDEQFAKYIYNKIDELFITGITRIEYSYTYPGVVENYNTFYAYDFENDEPIEELKITVKPSGFKGDNIISSPYSYANTVFDVAFESSDETMKLGNATTEYRTHPAFWWDNDSDGYVDKNETIAGIWVSKFNSQADKKSECSNPLSLDDYLEHEEYDEEFGDYYGYLAYLCDNANQNPTNLPNNGENLRFQTISNMFYTSRNISKKNNVYGLTNETINSHMMKNSEWGAVTYIAESNYGIKKLTLQKKEYGSTSIYPQSTTGNISGVFDMADNIAVMARGDIAYSCGEIEDRKGGDCSGFNKTPDTKYIDLYDDGNFSFMDPYYFNLNELCTVETCGGHGLYEGNYSSSMPLNYGEPWLVRIYLYDTLASWGDYYWGENTWRSVLVPGFGD